MNIYEQHSQMVQDLKSKDYGDISERMDSKKIIDLLHASIGIHTEGAEIADQLKRHVFYGTPLDEVNIKEEIGDLLWYVQLAAKTCNFTLEEAMDVNILKLRQRYGSQFSRDAAVNRDLDVEREVLEK